VDYNHWIEAWKEPANPNAPTVSIENPESGSIFEAPVSITIEATVADINNDVTKVEFYNGQLLLGADTEPPYDYTLTNLGVGNYFISAEAVDAEGLRGYSNIVSLKVNAPKVMVISTNVPPTIDGIIDEIWNNEEVMSFEMTNPLIGTNLTDHDLAGTAKMLWDNTYAYLLASITDDVKVNDSPNTYEDDNVEFYFDLNNAKSSVYDADDVQYSFGWNDGSTVGALPAGKSVAGITYRVADSEQGYTVEASIPWSILGGQPEHGKEIGFEVMINDDDDGGGRDAKLSWNAAADQAWQDASLFGTIKLVASEAIPGAPLFVPKKYRDSMIIFPNPVNTVLQVQGVDVAFDYEIFDLAGRMHLSGKAQDSISLKTLVKGVYILKVDNVQYVKFVKE